MNPNPVANAPRQSTAHLWAKTEQPDLYGRSTTKADLRAVGRSYPVKARGPRGAKRLVGERNREHAPRDCQYPGLVTQSVESLASAPSFVRAIAVGFLNPTVRVS